MVTTGLSRRFPGSRLNAGHRVSGAIAGLLATLTCGYAGIAHARPPLTASAYALLNQRSAANTAQFFVYQNADSGFNHGFASGFFGTANVSVNLACIDDPSAADGCSSDPAALDEVRGTVAQVTFPALGAGGFTGLDFEEPQGFLGSPRGNGYDLTGATRILFSVRSPTGITLQFGLGEGSGPGATTQPVTIAAGDQYAEACISAQGPAAQTCPPEASYKLDLNRSVDLHSVHLLFTVVTNVNFAPNGGVILLDDIRYDPVPSAQATVPSLPLSTQTFGVVPLQHPRGPASRVPIPPDQVNRNVASVYEASLTALALFARGETGDLSNAQEIADALVYALAHDNQGDPLPVAPDGATGLHNTYEAGDLPLFNSQGPNAGQAGQIRLAGYSIAPNAECGAAGFCLVLDGATGGNNAFAILALLKAFENTQQPSYLSAARQIGRWIFEQLLDNSGTGYGGYFLGYPDQGTMPKTLITSKSTENNADIFAAFAALSRVERSLGHPRLARIWLGRARIAGDFVIAMFDTQRGCLFAGTVPPGTAPAAGVDPTGARLGEDIINRADFLDANSFAYLAMASTPHYRNAIDWSRVPSCLDLFRSSVQAAGHAFSGYDLVPAPTSGPNGVAWEFTGQAAVVIESAGSDASSIIAMLRLAKAAAPFTDHRGVVAATLARGAALPPIGQCLSTPFQCIPQRVGIAATAWGIFVETGVNVFQ